MISKICGGCELQKRCEKCREGALTRRQEPGVLKADRHGRTFWLIAAIVASVFAAACVVEMATSLRIMSKMGF